MMLNVRLTAALMPLAASASLLSATSAYADWSYTSSPTALAYAQSGNMALELMCDSMRFVPAGYEESERSVAEGGFAIRFLSDGHTQVGAFQVGAGNATVRIVDNYPVEILLNDAGDYGFILDQLAANAVVNISMTSQDMSYGIFDLSGSGAAIRSLRGDCGVQSTSAAPAMEAPEGVVYCGGGAIERQIEYRLLDDATDEWDARAMVNGEEIRAMTSYSYFGNSQAPEGFVVALLGEDRSEFLVFELGGARWIEYGDYRYDQCN